ncbi:MAG: hypothetical protein EBY07_06470 [Actinobacteria bacterium]|jgi:hypothetical protein|nr:hypothetical protein [Actinomycetota bacterium]
MSLSPFSEQELEQIAKKREDNNRLEEFLSNKRDEWIKNIKPIYDELIPNFNRTNAGKIIEIQSLALSYRQMINEQIAFFLNKRSKQEVFLKELKNQKFIFYAIGFSVKTNSQEKVQLVEAHLAEYERNIQLLETHVDFLRATGKNLESVGFTVKNVNDLMSYLQGT